MTPHRYILMTLAPPLATLALSGCVLAPAGAKQEKAAVALAGQPYTQPFEKRVLPELPHEATWQDVLQRAFLANGDLETAYFDWRAAVERINQAAAYPNANATVGFNYLFSGGQMKAWDRTTISAGFDPTLTLRLPQKTAQAGKVAYDEARAAGERFAAAKFDLQRKVLNAYLDFALMAETIRIQQENLDLLKMTTEQAGQRVRTGAPQQDLLKAQIAQRMADNELASMKAQHTQMQAMLNGMLARPATASLGHPTALPVPRPINADDAALISMGVDRNPELAALAHQVAGRQDALALAKMAYLPDINPSASITGSVSQSIGAMLMLPTAIPIIEGQIKESQASLRGAQAALRQTAADRGASLVANLYALRNAERQAALLQEAVLPKARQAFSSSRQAYANGQISFVDLLDGQRTLLDIRRLIAEARIEREKRLADLEALAGVDVETLGHAATQPAASAPATMKSEVR